MASSHSSMRRSGGSTLSVVFLLATMALAGIFAYGAWDAARSQRATAEDTLRDYAALAAWQYADRARNVLESTFQPLSSAARFEPSLPRLRAVLSRRFCECPYDVTSTAAYFMIDLERDRLDVIADRDQHDLDWLRADVSARVAADTLGAFNMVVGPRVSGGTAVAATWTVRDGDRTAKTVYGLVVPIAEIGRLLAVECSRQNLLPPVLAGDHPTDSLLFISVSTPAHEVVFESPARHETLYSAQDTLTARYAGLIVTAAIRPDAAAELIIGGLPGSRLPLILGLFALTLGVGVAALFQFRRERELARLRDEFVSGVSHELRTPLAQIRVFGELLDQGNLRTVEERQRSASVISREARRLTHLVENILHFSRLRRSATRLTMVHTKVRTLLGETTEAFLPLARQRNVHLEEHVAEDFTLVGDRDALSQILLNLLDNALKYGPDGQTVGIGAERAGECARLWVEDQGPGVPVADRARIWEPYRRLERRDASSGGCGIGLAVVDELVRLHGGHAWVEDGAVGARFVIELPHAQRDITATPRTPSREGAQVSLVG